MPFRRNAKRDRPIRRMLVNGRVALVSQLIAVILECLSKRTEFWPRFVTRRAGHAVFPGERGNGMHLCRQGRQSGRRTAFDEMNTADYGPTKQPGKTP